MKNFRYIGLTVALALVLNACEQEVIELKDPEIVTPGPDCPDGASAGSADFGKFIAIGNSFVAGVQGGALFNNGQANSLAAIVHNQLKCVGAPATFNQPNIGAELGWNLFVTQPFLSDMTKPVLGRMLLQYGTEPDCATGEVSPRPTPQAHAPGNLEALPNPQANPGFMYTGSKTELNNFAVPAVTIGQFITPATGNWAVPDPAEGFTPFYGRFASAPGTSTIISDAIAADGTFFLFWAGMDDFFLYAAFGGDEELAPLTPPNAGFPTGFDFRFGAAITSVLASDDELEGVVGNFPDVFKMPHFTAVSYNPIPLDATTAGQLTAGFAGYNAALDGLIANKEAFGISDELAAEIATRKLSFAAGCQNKIMLVDETLTDLGPYFDGLQGAGAITPQQRAMLAPYQQIRHSTPTDIIPLSTGSILGTDGTFGKLGVNEPVGDRWVIIPAERDEINAARTAYNTIISTIVSANSTRLALADTDAAFNGLIAAQFAVNNGVTITPNINPPTGIFSEDGVHPNARGYAFFANVFIDAINQKFGATIPKVNFGKYKATGLPID